MKNYKILIVGLGSIGQNLALSLSEKGYEINAWDINKKKGVNTNCRYNLNYVKNINNFIRSNKLIIILAIPSGANVDNFVNKSIHLFKKNTYIVDIGNNHPSDTIKRHNLLKTEKVTYIGCGFSGGTEGARNNASIMIGCNSKDFLILRKLLIDISGKENKKFLKLIGSNPSTGNYVKIVHNAIEYGVMQSVADYYLLMKKIFQLKDNQIINELEKLNHIIGNSYLITITKKIIENQKSSKFLIKNILDQVDDNKTGPWAVGLSMECKFPIPSLTSSVESRFISKQVRIFKSLKKSINKSDIVLKEFLENAKIVTKMSIVACYIQGIGMLKKISKDKKININLKNVILSWSNNSIIRADLLKNLLKNIKINNIDIKYISKNEFSLKKREKLLSLMKFLIKNNLFLPSVSAIYGWSNMLSHKKNISFSLIQSQRNYFGSHKIKFFNK